MRIAVINEGSTKTRNVEIIKALSSFDHEVFNLGMKNVDNEPDLTYMETGLLTALLLNLKAVDFVVGGCGTGQGYTNMVLQFPGTACGIICDPVDAFLFARVNAGNCISLSLNKGYGNLGGDLNAKYIFEKLFDDAYGQGYPDARKDIQIAARKKLETVSIASHKSMQEILKSIDSTIVENAISFPGIIDFIKTAAPESDLKAFVLEKNI